LLTPGTALASWEFPTLDFEIFGRDVSIELTNTFKYTYHIADDLGAHTVVKNKGQPNEVKIQRIRHQFLDTLNFSLSSGVFRVGGRFDLNLFADRGSSDFCPGEPWCNQEADGRRYQDTFSAERLFFTVAEEAFDVTLGDFYVCFAKGIALSVVKLSELGQDNAVRGGKISIHHGPLDVTLLGGQFNALDLEEAEGWSAPWDSEPVVAGRVEYRILETVGVGAHGVLILRECGDLCDDKSSSVSRVDRDLVGGVNVDVPDLLDGALAFYAEFNVKETVFDDEATLGYALYGSVIGAVGDFNVLGEFKWYDNFDLSAPTGRDESYKLRYHQPPTLEWIRAEINNNYSITGFRVRPEYNFGELGPVELTAFLNYGYFRPVHNEGLGDSEIHNPFGGVELEWLDGDGNGDVTVGVRREIDMDADRLYHQDVFLEVNVEQLLVDSHSMKLSTVLLMRDKIDFVDLLGNVVYKDWTEVELTLDYRFSPWMSLTFSYERNASQEGRENYFGGGGRFFINPSNYVEVWGGQNKPGIKCRNGNCRFFPAFSGVKVLLVGRL